MKPWILNLSHFVSATTSLVCSSLAPLVVYGAISWHANGAEPIQAVLAPFLSLAFGVAATALSGVLSVKAMRLTERAGWNGWVFPVLLASTTTVAGACVPGVSTLGALGIGVLTLWCFGSYWAPLRQMQRLLPRLDRRGARLRQARKVAVAPPSRPISL